MGDDKTSPANIVVSTILEAENVVPLLKEYQQRGRQVNVLYSFPLFPSGVPRLASISSALGPNALSLMVDHPDQLPCVAAIHQQSGHKPLVYMKVDMGYRRAGVIPSTEACETLIDGIIACAEEGNAVFHGIYAHAGHSYLAREDWQALDYLAAEFKALEEVAGSIRGRGGFEGLVLSVGATPTATSLQHPGLDEKTSASEGKGTALVNDYLTNLKSAGYELEIHAGVYPALDLQQLATHARDKTLLSSSSIAITVLCEIASLYPGRGPGDTTEALINAGCLALGREPCANVSSVPSEEEHYAGWGIVSPWDGLANPVPGSEFPVVYRGWQVGKVSQEHGILRWAVGKGRVSDGQGEEEAAGLRYGQRVRIWPNHACVAGAGFEYYFVVDSRRVGGEDEVVDVWPRWRGW